MITRAVIVKHILPLVVPVLAGLAMTVVYIRLSCIDGATLCQNVTELTLQTAKHPTGFQEFLNLWTFG